MPNDTMEWHYIAMMKYNMPTKIVGAKANPLGEKYSMVLSGLSMLHILMNGLCFTRVCCCFA